jgi:hypothetical protein
MFGNEPALVDLQDFHDAFAHGPVDVVDVVGAKPVMTHPPWHQLGGLDNIVYGRCVALLKFLASVPKGSAFVTNGVLYWATVVGFLKEIPVHFCCVVHFDIQQSPLDERGTKVVILWWP